MNGGAETVTMLEEAIERLQIGIVMQLTLEYGSRIRLVPPAEAVTLANCVLSYATAMDPIGEHALHYEKQHTELIRTHAHNLAASDDVAKALSYLYAAITLLLVIRTPSPFSELSARLGARASELSLYIPSTYDLCGSGDAVACIHAIAAFSADYRQRLTGTPR